MKRFLLLCLLTLCSYDIWAYPLADFSLENADGVTIYYRITSTNTVEVQNGSSTIYAINTYSGHVSIPETVEYQGKTFIVTGIGMEAFCTSESLSSVEIPSTVTYFGQQAFGSCSSLAYIEIPNSVLDVGNGAFASCTALTSIDMPESVETLAASIFSGCTNLEFVKLPRTVSSLGSRIFSGCTSLKEVELPINVKSVTSRLFIDCPSLPMVTLPREATVLQAELFNRCTSLERITLSSRVEEIDGDVFLDCENLKTVYSLNFEPPFASGTGQFDGISSECVLYVPTGAKELYEKESGWKDCFNEIVEIDVLSVTTTSASDITESSAVLKGSLSEGSFEVVEKGFECWKDDYNVIKIKLSSDDVSVKIEDLDPGTTYNYCVYAIDETGPVYGRTRTFTTEIPDGVSSVTASKSAEACAYYTTSGQRVNTSQKGVNIVRMSDGTTKKVLVK